jgi:hypothetical protein
MLDQNESQDCDGGEYAESDDARVNIHSDNTHNTAINEDEIIHENNEQESSDEQKKQLIEDNSVEDEREQLEEIMDQKYGIRNERYDL